MNALKEFREKYKYNQKEFAETLGIDRSALWRIEKGICKPSFGTLMGIKRIIQQHEGKNIPADLLEYFLLTTNQNKVSFTCS